MTEIKVIINEAKELGIRVLVIAGEGESFLYNIIRDVIEEADKIGLIPYVFTNGSLLNEELLLFLKSHNTSLVINLDSLEKDTYEKLCGLKGSFDHILRNLENVRKIYSDTHSQVDEYALRKIAINMVVSNANAGEIKKIRDFCGDDFVFVINVPIYTGRALSSNFFEDMDDIERNINSMENTPLGTISGNKWCAYMRNGISIGARGEILTCAYSLESSDLLGNVRNGGLKKATDRANSAVDKFYRENEHGRCILRHPNYELFINQLKEAVNL